MKKVHRKYIVLAFILTLLFALATCIGVSGVVFAAEDYRTSDVMTDLNASTIDGVAFKAEDYPADSTRSLQLLNFVEYAYAYNEVDRTRYSLYCYVYNPAKIDIKADSAQNKIQLASKYDDAGEPSNFEKYDIQLISASDDGLFYKYKIIDHVTADGTTFSTRVNRDSRRYDISGIELLTKGARNATEYSVGLTFNCAGFAKGLGQENASESSLKMSYQDFNTLLLNVHHAYWRSDSVNSLGVGHYNQVNSVYFSVPSVVWNEYDNLESITCEWWEYKTAPALITSNEILADLALKYVDTDVGNYDENVPIKLFYGVYHVSGSGGSNSGYYVYQFAYNINNPDGIENNINIIPFAFYAPVSDINIDSVFSLLFRTNTQIAGEVASSTVADYIYNYSNDLGNGYINCNGRLISVDLFDENVDDGHIKGYNSPTTIRFDDLFDLQSYKDTHTWWETLGAFGIGSGINTGDGRENVSPIIELTSDCLAGTDEEISKKLMIDIEAVGSLKQYYNTEISAGNTVILFRHSVTDYFATQVGYAINDETTATNQSDAYIAQQTVYLDFDVIQLDFERSGEIIPIAAVSSPVDIINGFTPPPYKEGIGLAWWVYLIIALGAAGTVAGGVWAFIAFRRVK